MSVAPTSTTSKSTYVGQPLGFATSGMSSAVWSACRLRRLDPHPEMFNSPVTAFSQTVSPANGRGSRLPYEATQVNILSAFQPCSRSSPSLPSVRDRNSAVGGHEILALAQFRFRAEHRQRRERPLVGAARDSL